MTNGFSNYLEEWQDDSTKFRQNNMSYRAVGLLVGQCREEPEPHRIWAHLQTPLYFNYKLTSHHRNSLHNERYLWYKPRSLQ